MIRVAIIIDVPFYREGLATLLAQSTDVAVVADVACNDGIATAVADVAPDVVLLDISAANAREAFAAVQRSRFARQPLRPGLRPHLHGRTGHRLPRRAHPA